MRLVQCPSPNHDARPQEQAIDMLVLHYTGMKTAEEALARLCDPASKVSAHYTIDRKGCIYAHVPEDQRAWHAGVSWWDGSNAVNARSIGIELVNPGHEFGYVAFTESQIAALIDLSHAILARHPIAPSHVVGHSDVAPARKEDPGELFPWEHLAEFGIGRWPQRNFAKLVEPIDQALAQLGYGVAPDVDVPLEKVIAAFQRHFRPSRMDGVADSETSSVLASLIAG